MPKEGIDQPVVIDAIADYAEKVLGLIADDSEEGRKRLIAITDTSREKYNQPSEYWGIGWVYKYTRVLDNKVSKIIREMELTPELVGRLEKFKELMQASEHSYNYNLFVEIIKSVPGYEFPQSKQMDVLIERLKVHLLSKIDSFIASYNSNQKLIEIREEERKKIQQTLQKPVDHALILNNIESAKVTAVNKRERVLFALQNNNSVWELSWVDFTGKIYKLDPNEELIKLLVDHAVQDVETLNAVYMKRLKRECCHIRDSFLDKTQVLLNPLDPVYQQPMSDDALIKEGACAVFVLRGKPQSYRLSWINTLSQVKEIELKEHPEFEQYLQNLRQITDEQLNQIKTYLLHVNTKKSIGMDDFKTKLNQCLSASPKLAAPSKEIQTKRLNLSLFAGIEKCLQTQLNVNSVRTSSPEVPVAGAKVAVPKRLNVENYAIAALFKHQSKSNNYSSQESNLHTP